VTFKKQDNMILRLKDPATKNVYDNAGLVDKYPNIPLDKWIAIPDGTPAEITAQIALYKRQFSLLDENFANGKLFHLYALENTVFSPTWEKIKSDEGSAWDEALVKAVLGEWTPEQAGASYRAKAKARGAQKVLEEANAYGNFKVPAGYVY